MSMTEDVETPFLGNSYALSWNVPVRKTTCPAICILVIANSLKIFLSVDL